MMTVDLSNSIEFHIWIETMRLNDLRMIELLIIDEC